MTNLLAIPHDPLSLQKSRPSVGRGSMPYTPRFAILAYMDRTGPFTALNPKPWTLKLEAPTPFNPKPINPIHPESLISKTKQNIEALNSKAQSSFLSKAQDPPGVPCHVPDLMVFEFRVILFRVLEEKIPQTKR